MPKMLYNRMSIAYRRTYNLKEQRTAIITSANTDDEEDLWLPQTVITHQAHTHEREKGPAE